MHNATFGSVRTWLNQTLFPDPPPPQRIGGRRTLVVAGLALLAVAVQMVRMWPSAPLNSIWAEDGKNWLGDSLYGGVTHSLTTPYSGYLQTVSRLIAAPVSMLPVAWFAPAMAISGAAIVAGCALIVWSASAGHITKPYLRATLAAMVVLLPIVGVETLDNVTNSIWFLLFAAFWILLWRPATLARAVGVAAVLLLAVLSNGGTIFLFPLWLLRLVALRDRRDRVIVASYAIGIAIQLVLSWDVRNERGENLSPFVRAIEAALGPPQWHWSLLPAYVQRIVGGAATGQRITGYLWVHLGTPFEIALGIALIAFVAFAIAGTDRRTRVIVPLTVAISLGIFLFEGYQRWTSAGSTFLWPKGTASSRGYWDDPHYFVVPTLLLLSAIFMRLDAHPRLISPTAWRSLQTVGVLFVVFAALLSFNVSDPSFRGSPTWSRALSVGRSQCVRKHQDTVEIVTAPYQEGFPGAWEIPISCSKLTRSTFVSNRPPKQVTQSLRTEVLVPTNGAILSGMKELLDASATKATSVEFRLFGGSYGLNAPVICVATPTYYGWLCNWNTTTVPNGSFFLASETFDTGRSAFSSGVSVTVHN